MLLNSTSQENGIAVSRETLGDRAADMLRELILLDELKADEILAERKLSDKLGISRTPLREALRVLASEGLVEMTPNLRPRVANPSLDQLLDLIDVLSSLERLACEIVARCQTSAIIDRLEHQVHRMKNFPDDGDELEFFKVDMDFHKTIVESTNNQPLIRTHRQYNAAVFRARFMSTKWVARRPLMHDQHSAICDLLRARNGIAAGELMKSHLQQLKVNVTELFQAKEAEKNGVGPLALKSR
jgi:DNA-binding GntR family transcriptional regulator